MALQVRELRVDDLGTRDLDRWSALAGAALEPNPFFEPDFLVPAATELGEPRSSLIVVEDAHAWRVCLPVQRTRLGGVVPAVRAWCHRYCFLGTPLLDPERPVEAVRALLGHAAGRGSRPLVLERQAHGGPVWLALEAAAADLGLATAFETAYERALLPRRAVGDGEGLSGRRRRDLDRLSRRLEAELGGKLETHDEAGSDDAVDAFLALECSGWKGAEGTALASDPRHAAFFRQVCRSFAARDSLELLSLRGGGRRAAMSCNLYSGEGGFCFKVAHDEELRPFSPGVQLERASIRVFREQRTELWQDSCADAKNEMINRLWPGRRRIVTTVLARQGLRARGLRRAMGVARAGRRTTAVG